MPEIVTDRDAIREYQNRFQCVIRNNMRQEIKALVKHPDATRGYDIRCDNANNLWYTSKIIDQEPEIKRYWNAFGFYESLSSEKPLSITCEINFHFFGKDKRVAGLFFKKDESNTIYVGHRGKITIKGHENGESGFWDNYQGESITINNNRIAVIGSLDDNNFYYNIVSFIKEIRRIKNII